ncbi:MAG: RNA polymerase sigma factor [Deltaproteobacteria bacterium]
MAQESDHEQFTALFEAHGGALMGLLRRLCGNQPDADDAFQETAVRVWKNLSSRPWLRNPRSWLMSIGYRAFLDLQTRRPRGEPLLDPPDASARSPRELAEKAEDCDRVHTAIGTLPDRVREVVVLHYVGGLSISQTAAAMGIADGTVKSRLNSALATLRSALE